MQTLNSGRFGMGAALSGTMRAVIAQAAEYTAARAQTGRPVREYSSTQQKICSMAVLHYVTESIAYVVAANMDHGADDFHLEAAVSKIFASESAWTVVDEAIQILGGHGYMREAGLEKRLRDLRIFRIFEGTNGILRLFIALTGLQFAGGHLRQTISLVKKPLAHPDLLLKEGRKRTLRALGVNSSSGVNLEPLVHSELRPVARKIDQAIGDFGVAAEILLRKYGKGVVDEQFRLKRVADCVIDLYASVCVVARANRALEDAASSARHESLMARLWCDGAVERISMRLLAIDDKTADAHFQLMREISQNVVEAEGAVQGHPLGV